VDLKPWLLWFNVLELNSCKKVRERKKFGKEGKFYSKVLLTASAG